jgi:hypothetical protein
MKYEALRAHLQKQTSAKLRMSFAEVAKAAKVRLPASAYRYPAWWANDPAHHAQARAWTEAGYRTQNVDLEAQRVEFVRVEAFKVHPAYGAMKGTFTIRDWDVTKPALDPEELAEWEANIEGMAGEKPNERTSPERRGVREMQPNEFKHQTSSPMKKHPMAGALKGTFTIAPGWDLTRPSLDEDELAEMEANLDRTADLIDEGLRRKT